MASEIREYDPGDVVVIRGTFRNRAEALVTPATHLGEVKPPSTAKAAVLLSEASVGVLEGEYELAADAEPGDYWYRIAGLTGVKAAGQHVFRVRRRMVLPS